MRFGSVLAGAAMLTAATPALAATIVQNLPAVEVSGGDFAPYDIIGAPFNPALGTLNAVTATLTGSYTPAVALSEPVPPSPEVLSTSYFVFAGAPGGPNFFSGALGSQTLPVPGASGTPTPFSRSFNFGDVSAFISPVPGPTALAYYGFISDANAPSLSDFTTFAGTFALKYTYVVAAAVPEPSSLALLAVGLLGLGLTLRRQAG